jgi:4-hydroxy-3-polyprenylbenzoate decarboxylase
LASVVHDYRNQGAVISSGSFLSDGMVVAPCSMKTLAAISAGFANNLVQRAADVALKEQRKLVLVVRETPLSPIHLENMLKLSKMGVVIMPPMPAFYNDPKTMDDLVEHLTMRVLDQFGISVELAKRWE